MSFFLSPPPWTCRSRNKDRSGARSSSSRQVTKIEVGRKKYGVNGDLACSDVFELGGFGSRMLLM